MAEKLSAKSAWKLNNALKKSAATKPTKVGTARVTRRDSDGSVWVRLPGSNVDTPVNGQILSDAQVGDTVSVRIENGRLSLMGNASTPSVGQQQVNTTVQPVRQTADNALETAGTAQVAAELATSYAAAAQADADRAKDAADEADAKAQAASDAADLADGKAQAASAAAQIADGKAQAASAAAQIADGKAQAASDSAASANASAKGALLSLATVEDVVDTLTWITKHGIMTLTTDTTVDPSKVYFTPDASGQYVVGGSSYSIVQNPTTEGLSGYYELTIDKSVENYIATHVSVTDEGLWLTPTSSNGYRVLIATGAGTTYTTAGTYIIDNSGNIRAIIGETITLGGTNESHVVVSQDAITMLDAKGNVFMDVRDNGLYQTRTYTLTASGLHGTGFPSPQPMLIKGSETDVTITVDGVPYEYGVDVTFDKNTNGDVVKLLDVWFIDTVPAAGSTIVVTFRTESDKTYTLGKRTDGTTEGPYSVVEGYNNEASGYMSHAEGGECSSTDLYTHAEGNGCVASHPYAHAEGWDTTSSGNAAHSEGLRTVASGAMSHAQNAQTIAASNYQTALGHYNVADANSTYAVIVGNGTSASARSNALTVDWNGNIVAQAMAGIIQMFAGATPPSGWLECDGQEVSRTTYAVLFAAIGTTWGAGDGSTTFNLPDLRGRGPIGAGTGSGLTARTLGDKGGSESHNHGGNTGGHTITVDEMPSHNHTINHGHAHTLGTDSKGGHDHKLKYLANNSGSGSNRHTITASGDHTTTNPVTNTAGEHTHDITGSITNHTGNSGNKGGGTAHNHTISNAGNMQPFAVVKFIICTGKTS